MPVEVNRRVTLHQGRVFRLDKENITLDNGVTVDIELIRHPGAAAIVPLSARGTVMLIKQYRHAVGGRIWEIPAGTLDPGEVPLQCAQRELMEETGYRADTFHPLGEITPVPGYSDERIHLYLASGLTAVPQNLDQDEILAVHETPFDAAMEMLYRGEIQDSKTICGLSLAAHWLSQHALP
jgi:ADP-ribose pyrophosphatase